MDDYAEDNYYYIEKVKTGEEYHVALYKALMGIWEARETFINSLQEGITYRKLELGIEKDGEKSPFLNAMTANFIYLKLRPGKNLRVWIHYCQNSEDGLESEKGRIRGVIWRRRKAYRIMISVLQKDLAK